jgi:beta-lactamase class A
MLTRRDTLLGAAALGACAPLAQNAAYTPPPNDRRFAAIEQRIGGRVGVAAWNAGTGDWLGHRIQERFAMCSSFKWALAAGVLHSAQNGGRALDEQVHFSQSDIIPNSPRVLENLSRGAMSVEELCAATVMHSDNAAANLLLTGMMGPAGLTAFLRANGDGSTRLDRTETALNENLPNDPRDTSAPDVVARTLHRFLLTDAVLNRASRAKLVGWMEASPTGRDRIRRGVPATWRGADKTGTSDSEHNATNDVAILWPPNLAPIVVVVYLSDSVVDLTARKAAHVEIGRIIAEEWG